MALSLAGTTEESLFQLFANAPISIWYEDYTAVGDWMAQLRHAGVTDLEAHLAEHPDLVHEAIPLIRVLDVNETSLRVFGASSRRELIDGLPTILAGEECRHTFVQELLTIWKGEPEFDCEFVAQTLQGKRVRYLLHMAIPREDGVLDLSRVVIAISDLSELRAAEEERAKLEAKLRRSQKLEALGRLAGGVAHDFNNMLTVILANAELLQLRTSVEDPKRDLVENIRKAVIRSRDTVSRLLVFSRQQVTSPTPIDLAAVIRDLQKGIIHLIGEDIELHVVCPESLWPVCVDRSQIEQAIFNLVLNARDAMPEGGPLTIRAREVEVGHGNAEVPPGDYVHLSIEDRGIGMNDADLERVFEPFFTSKDGGTGLGLAMVYGAVHQAGGVINVQSTLGAGSTFTIHLPRWRGPQPDASSVPRGIAARGAGVILVVEDDPLVLGAVSEMLRDLGYEIITASRPEEALRVCGRGPIDLLITDVVMPGMNGKQLRDRIAAMQPRMKTLYMSGYATDDVLNSLELEADGIGFLPKPFERTTLAGAINALMRSFSS